MLTVFFSHALYVPVEYTVVIPTFSSQCLESLLWKRRVELQIVLAQLHWSRRICPSPVFQSKQFPRTSLCCSHISSKDLGPTTSRLLGGKHWSHHHKWPHLALAVCPWSLDNGPFSPIMQTTLPLSTLELEATISGPLACLFEKTFPLQPAWMTAGFCTFLTERAALPGPSLHEMKSTWKEKVQRNDCVSM